MEQNDLSKWLKVIILGCGICGSIIYVMLVPYYGGYLVSLNPELSYYFYPWLFFIWASGVPCYLVLILAWKVATNIGADRPFCLENAKRLKMISALSAGDAMFFFGMNLLYLLLNMNHPGVVLLSLFVVFAGAVVAVLSASLSYFVKRATVLKEQSDLTI